MDLSRVCVCVCVCVCLFLILVRSLGGVCYSLVFAVTICVVLDDCLYKGYVWRDHVEWIIRKIYMLGSAMVYSLSIDSTRPTSGVDVT
jgi:hypothetical protein